VSIPVELADLPTHIARIGPSALLVTNSSAGPPHVSSVAVTLDGDNLTMGAGRKTRANAGANPAVTIVWPAVDGEHCLIVDGQARDTTSDPFAIVPTSAVLHRLAHPPIAP
jgi:hypothetical protein